MPAHSVTTSFTAFGEGSKKKSGSNLTVSVGGWYTYSFIPATPHTMLAVGSDLDYALPWTALGSPAQTYVLGCVNYSAWNDRREYVPNFPRWVRLHIAP